VAFSKHSTSLSFQCTVALTSPANTLAIDSEFLSCSVGAGFIFALPPRPPDVPSLCELFTQKGIFPLDVFEKLAKSTDSLPPAKLVALLQHLNIVALLRKDGASSQYFIPCVLAHSEPSKSTGTSLSSACPLLVAFKSGYCPKGLFGAVVVYLLQNKMQSILEWELEQDKIFQNQICFSVGPYDSFQLTVLPSFLSIELCSSSGASTRMISLPSVCSEVCLCINNAISTVSEILHCSRKAAHSFAFFCPGDGCANQSPHPATVTFFHGKPCILRCPVTQKRFDLPEGCQDWFSGVGCNSKCAWVNSHCRQEQFCTNSNKWALHLYVG